MEGMVQEDTERAAPCRVTRAVRHEGTFMAIPPLSDPLPIPPFEMRQLVGPTDEAAFNNPTGDAILGVPESQFDAVLDFGCGCGRLARQMLQQRVPPRRYVGFDLHAGMVRWCQTNLAPRAPGFEFLHHDVDNMSSTQARVNLRCCRCLQRTARSTW